MGTRDIPASPEKRPRGATSSSRAGLATNRAFRSGSSASTASANSIALPVSSAASTRNGVAGSGSTNVLIAPPPRVAFGGGSSATPSPRASSPASIKTTSSTLGSTSIGSGPASTSGTNSSPLASAASAVAAAAATTSAQLRERDERIAALEKELELMEGEFTRELDKLSAAESETATFWQGKHSALHQSFLRTDTDLRVLRGEAERWAKERDELRAERDMLRREAREREDEVSMLMSQVRGLKEWVSTSTRADGAAVTSDEVFAEGMANLGNGLQNWVVVNFRKAKLDISNASEATLEELGQLVPQYEELISSAKVHLLQSIVSRELIETIFDNYFVGLTQGQTQQLQQSEALIASLTSTEIARQWRSTTLAVLKKEAAQSLQAETAAITERTALRINGILDSISDATQTEARNQGLKGLVTGAIELARLLVVQRAKLKVIMPTILPHQRTLFDPTTMEDIGGEDEEDLADREISCVTFPGIEKRGGDEGAHPAFRNVICKARVLCRTA